MPGRDIVVGGSNFGCGSEARETHPLALSGAGIHFIIAQSFARIFYRNAINVGLLPPICPDAGEIPDGSKISVRIRGGYIEYGERKLTFEPVPNFSRISSMQGPSNSAVTERRCLYAQNRSDRRRRNRPRDHHRRKKVLDAAAERLDFGIEWTDFDISSERYLKTGELVTDEDLRNCVRSRPSISGPSAMTG